MWYDNNCRDRILRWRDWRLTMDSLPFDEALLEVARTWAMIPIVNHYLAPDQVLEWPDPWMLIDDNHYCDLARCLGMYYSLMLSKHKDEHEFSIAIYKDADAQSWYHLCLVDNGKYVLNWDLGQVLNISPLPESAKLIHHYKEIALADKLG